jgi:acyl CoA:acetate/3-ketoacid CoA transferase beta subunit
MSDYTRAELCVVACADAFRGDGEILASPMGPIPSLGARVARATFEPDLMLSDGAALLLANTPALGAEKDDAIVEGWMPFRTVFDCLWWGKRHVMMGATQIDAFGNQNISCLGDWNQPKVQLLGVRGAPGNTLHHTTSYFVAKHSPRVFVEAVDMVCGVGYDRARSLPHATTRNHEIRRVVTNLAVLDFETSDGRMRVRSIHPGVSMNDLIQQTGFKLSIDASVPLTREPTSAELELIRDRLDPSGIANKIIPE